MDKIAELMGGARITKASELATTSNKKTGSVISQVIQAVEDGDLETLSETSQRLSTPLSSVTANKLSTALLDQDTWPIKVAEILQLHDVLPIKEIIRDLCARSLENQQQSWEAACWMFRDEQASHKFWNAGTGSQLQLAPLNNENLKLFSKLDWSLVLVGSEMKDHGYMETELTRYIFKKLDKQHDPTLVGHLVSAMLSPESMAARFNKRPSEATKYSGYKPKNPDSGPITPKEIKVIKANYAAELYLSKEDPKSDSLEKLQWIEKVLEHSPELHEPWRDMWNVKHKNTREAILEHGVPNLEGEAVYPGAKSVIERTVRFAPEWIDEAIKTSDELGQCIRKSLSKRGTMHICLYSMSAQRRIKIIPTLLEHFSKWEDEKGNNIGLLLEDVSGGQSGAIKALLKYDTSGLLTKPNHRGETLFDRLEQAESWQNDPMLAKIKRQQLSEHISGIPETSESNKQMKM